MALTFKPKTYVKAAICTLLVIFLPLVDVVNTKGFPDAVCLTIGCLVLVWAIMLVVDCLDNW